MTDGLEDGDQSVFEIWRGDLASPTSWYGTMMLGFAGADGTCLFEDQEMPERLSFEDESIYYGFSHHIQRYEFAARYCDGKRVLDAGCGTGYGSNFLAIQGAREVVAVDIADEALAEAGRNYHRSNLTFLKADVENLPENGMIGGSFDTIVNLENLEHLQHGDRFVDGARARLGEEGTLVVSTPNGDLTERDEQGRIKNEFHIKEYSRDELVSLLQPRFGRVEVFGQWRTPAGKARLISETKQFELVCELYYNPLSRAWRMVKKVLGKPCAAAPSFDAAGLGLPWEFTIASLADAPFPWAPEVLIAVCRV